MYLLPILCLIPVIFYLYLYVKKMVKFFKEWKIDKRIKILIVAIVLMVSVFTFATVGIIFILHLFIIAFLIDFLNVIVRQIKKISKRKNLKLWDNIYNSGLLPIVLSIILMIYGYFNIRNVVETDYTIYTNKNIREEGYKIALVSDLHFGTAIGIEELEKYCKEIEATNADFLVLCGDIVDESTTLEGLKESLKALGNVKSKYGTFFVYGNHDRAPYRNKKNYSEEDLKEELLKNNIKILSDDTYELTNDFEIIGREDVSFFGTTERKGINTLMEGVDKDKFLLLLDHQPVGYKENLEIGIDLQLSGHTHGGQIWPVGLICETFKIGDLNYGYKKMDNFQAIVSSGIIGWGFPVRTERNSEYVIINIERE